MSGDHDTFVPCDRGALPSGSPLEAAESILGENRVVVQKLQSAPPQGPGDGEPATVGASVVDDHYACPPSTAAHYRQLGPCPMVALLLVEPVFRGLRFGQRGSAHRTPEAIRDLGIGGSEAERARLFGSLVLSPEPLLTSDCHQEPILR